MAIRNAKLGGTDFTDGEVLYNSDLNDTFNAFYRKSYFDGSSYTVDSDNTQQSTAETDMNTITISQNDLGSSATLNIIADVKSEKNDSGSGGCTVRLYVNGVVVKTESLNSSIVTDSKSYDSTNMLWQETGVDSTAGNIIVKLTAQWGSEGPNPGNRVTNGLGLMVDAINNNS